MFEIILSIALAIGGAIMERETNGAVTQIVRYSDTNITVECNDNRR